MPDSLVPLNQLREVKVDAAAEVRRIIASKGLDQAPEGSQALHLVYRSYKNLKTLGFFRLVMEQFGNTVCSRDISLRVYDIYDVPTGKGRVFFMVEASLEAIEAFLDDGFVLLKVREWLADAYRRVCLARDDGDVLKTWDDAFHAHGSPLPPGVLVVPFYNKNLAPGVPGVVLVLVKEMRSGLR